MRKFLMITTAVYGLSLFAPAISQAQTCKQAPDCVDMGYDKSVDDCAGKKMLKCPFNTNFVSCEDGGNGDVLNLFDLAWEEAFEIPYSSLDTVDYAAAPYNNSTCGSLSNTFTFPADGCISGGSLCSGGYVNGTFAPGYLNCDTSSPNEMRCFKKGTVFGVCNNDFVGMNFFTGAIFIPAESGGAIKITYEVESGGSIDLSPLLTPIVATYGSVDWGDGTTDDILSNTKHTYTEAGVYSVTIRGNITTLAISTSNAYVLSFDQLNLKSLTNVEGKVSGKSFAGDCSKATGSIPELPPNLINGHYMFQDCSGLDGNIPTLPSRLTNGNRMFIDCSSLTGDIPTLPSTLTDGDYMFHNCTSLNGTINNSNLQNTQLNTAHGMFQNCSGLTGNIPALPSGITDGNLMFSKCSGLTGDIPTLPSTLTDGSYMFRECTGLRGSIPTLPSTLTEAVYMFHSCTGLSGNVPPLPPALIKGTRMFYGCSGLSGSITELPSTLTMGGYMFSGCSGLSGTSPQKPEGLTTFGNIFEGTHIENDGSWPDTAW